MSVDVGDAVLRFLGDTTQMDAAFASVGDKAKKGFQPATDALDDVQDGFKDAGKAGEQAADSIEDAGKRSTSSMREARGEAALLGEEFGIRLPRHVRNFVAELPGVGTALSAAFSATAILFIIQALFQAEEKLRAFLSHQKEHEEQQRLLEAEAKGIEDINKAAEKASLEMDKLTKSPVQLLTAKVASLTAEYDNLYRATYAPQAILAARGKELENEIALNKQLLDIEKEKEGDRANADLLKSMQQEISLRRQLAEVQVMYAEAVHGLDKTNADESRYQISLKALRAQAAAESKYGKDSVDKVREINAQIEQVQVEHTLHLQEELQKQQEALEKTMSDIQKDVKATGPVDIITPANIQRMLQGIAAVKSLGITLREDLIQKLNEAKQAEDDFAASGIKDSVALHALQAEVKKAQEALDNYGNTMDKTKAKSETTWKSIEQDWHNGSNSMHATAELAGQSFNQISTAMTSAFTSAIMGQKNVGKAFEEATKQAVASLAAQALVKALFYTAEGFAALAMAMMGDPSAGAAATQYFTAAAEMAGIGAVAGAASRAMPGGGSGSNSNSAIQQNNNGSNTSGSNRGTVSVTGVQKFAEGGLVSAPTLAIVGDSLRGGQGSEAVLPLDHPESLAKIGAGLSAMGMGGGGGVHIHLPHGSVISADTMQKFVGKMNKMVNRGQLDLTASKSMRVNKRSA